ncbi:MAG: thiamine pyrophosphate-binding protein [Verrucomicrobiae bacterium]|nr:thiamine pyrophosphate-binding protein [Verrucomicrobiae bacterium]
MAHGPTIGAYLIDQLHQRGARHVFGIPGDYVLGFYDELTRSKLRMVNTCDEQGAGFAADAYARVSGLGVVCITYCVGGLKVANTTAQAFAEKSPVVIISGAPGVGEQVKNPLLHHKVRDFDTQLKVFRELTCAATVLDDPHTAFAEIDRVLHACQRYQRPVYIELPRDVVHLRGPAHHKPRKHREESDPVTLRASLEEAVEMINRAKRPVILADVELHRFGLQEDLVRLVKKTNFPVAATLMGKSVIAEHYPQYLGIYEGAMGREEVRRAVEGSDCLIMLGVFMTDINLGIYTAQLDPGRSIYATSERLSIRHHSYDNVRFTDFLHGLLRARLRRRPLPRISRPAPVFKGRPASGPTGILNLCERLNAFLDDRTIVIADVGDCLFGAADLTIHHRTEFLATAYYASLGFAVPGAIGAQMASPKSRPLVLVGDGAFQMTGMELATVARYGLNPIIVVFNNSGYSTERPMKDGPFNDVWNWQFHKLPEVLGAGRGFLVRTVGELDTALEAARADTKTFSILNVIIPKDDRSPAMRRLTERLAARIK